MMTESKKNILIVDDIPDNLTVLSELLIAEGYTVRPVTSGSAALKTIASAIPDLILLDIKMPEMDGFQVCRRIKADDRLKDIPVIFISAYGEETEKIKAFEAGGVDYILKPFHSGEIYARVHTHLMLAETKRNLEQLNFGLEQMVFQRTRELEDTNSKLIKSGKMFSTAFQLNPLSMVIYTVKEKRVLQINKAFGKNTGFKSDEIKGKEFGSLNIIEDFNNVESLLLRGTDEKAKRVEALYITKENEKKTGLIYCERIDFADDECSLLVIEDITAMKQNEAKIKEQLEELQRWFNVTLDREGRVLELKAEVNSLLEKLNEPPKYKTVK